ncbi:restriction endonuclease subunit R [Bacteroidia bacterium]|nr:restriction endonuclease subunit R [Bacteroidia bacterium]
MLANTAMNERQNIQHKPVITDKIRKKQIVCTEEEKVRQYTIQHLINDCGVPSAYIAVEQSMQVVNRRKRADIVVYDRSFKPMLLVECKAPSVSLGQECYVQILQYNLTVKAPYILITNGLQSFCYSIDLDNESCQIVHELPKWNEFNYKNI